MSWLVSHETVVAAAEGSNNATIARVTLPVMKASAGKLPPTALKIPFLRLLFVLPCFSEKPHFSQDFSPNSGSIFAKDRQPCPEFMHRVKPCLSGDAALAICSLRGRRFVETSDDVIGF